MYNWTTAQVKQRAKNSFSSFGYWMPVLVMFIISLIPICGIEDDIAYLFITLAYGILFFIVSVIGWLIPPETIVNADGSSVSVGVSSFAPLSGVGIVLCAAFIIAAAAFVLCPVIVGRNRYFMEHRGSRSEIGRIFWAFGCGHYLNVVKIMLLMSLKIFLWSLLFIIPGIIKSFEYFAIPYILAENPGIDSKRAFELSRQMTTGEKFDIWWLGITFIGWWILCSFSFGIGQYFLIPYIQATKAEVYSVLRDKAHENGVSDFAELPGFFPAAQHEFI